MALETSILIDNFKKKSNDKFVEIGAGLGKVAYWSNKLGNSNYSIFDLPHVSALSAYYLIKSLGHEKVHLFGESTLGNTNKIKIFPSWYFKKIKNNSISMLINQDSLPEIDSIIAREYIDLSHKKVKGSFLSINQESAHTMTAEGHKQNIVRKLCDNHGGFINIGRFKSWTREGYVVELYKKKQKKYFSFLRNFK